MKFIFYPLKINPKDTSRILTMDNSDIDYNATPCAADDQPEYTMCACGYPMIKCHCPLAPLTITIPVHRYLRRFLLTPTASGKTAHGYLSAITEAIYDGVEEFRRGSGSMAEEEDIILDLVEKARDISHVMAFVVRALDSEPQRGRGEILEAEKCYAFRCIMSRCARDAAWIPHCEEVQKEMERMRAAEDPINRVQHDLAFRARCWNNRIRTAIETLDSKMEEKSRQNRLFALFIDKKVKEAQRAEDFYLRLSDLIADGHVLYTVFSRWDPVVYNHMNITLHKNKFPNDETKWTVTMKAKE